MQGLHVFFSSRRRHTRYWRDWSSDVCSSDLSRSPRVVRTTSSSASDPSVMVGSSGGPGCIDVRPSAPDTRPRPRTEETRGGEEGRFPGAPFFSKNKIPLRELAIYLSSYFYMH